MPTIEEMEISENLRQLENNFPYLDFEYLWSIKQYSAFKGNRSICQGYDLKYMMEYLENYFR
jgi:hypothetical protein